MTLDWSSWTDRKQATAVHVVGLHVKQQQGEMYVTLQTREQNPPAGTSTIDVALIAVDTDSDWLTDAGEKRPGEISVEFFIAASG